MNGSYSFASFTKIISPAAMQISINVATIVTMKVSMLAKSTQYVTTDILATAQSSVRNDPSVRKMHIINCYFLLRKYVDLIFHV